MSPHDIGLVCLNGHAINGYFQSRPEHNIKFCFDCGQPTTAKCPGCEAPIRGEYVSDYVGCFGPYDPPRHCHECGKPYPWTARRVEALREAIHELEGLEPDERERLSDSVPDLIADTPKSETAALRVKKAMARARGPGKEIFMNVLTNLATAGVKKLLGL